MGNNSDLDEIMASLDELKKMVKLFSQDDLQEINIYESGETISKPFEKKPPIHVADSPEIYNSDSRKRKDDEQELHY